MERPAPDVSGMESSQILLVNCRPDQSHLSFLLQEVDSILTGLLSFSFCVQVHPGSIVMKITRQYCFGPKYHKERSSPSRPIWSCPQSPQNRRQLCNPGSGGVVQVSHEPGL